VLKNSAIVACNPLYCNRTFINEKKGLKSTSATDDKQVVVNILPKKYAVLAACLALTGCGGGGFDAGGLLESHPVRLDGEQVMLSGDALNCGVREDLWTVSSLGDERSVGRLSQKARDLQFSDDVQIGDAVVGAPYAQIRGSFSVKVLQVGSLRDEDAFTKLADAKVGVKIDHSCFQNELPLVMGIKHGQFSRSTNPLFRFKMDGEWMVDQIIH
jgi:hypothetical protein